jgi:hypothetical protein
MSFDELLTILARRTEESLGQPMELPSGARRAFRLTAEYDDAELTRFEASWGVRFPPPYREFLLRVGASELGYGPGARGISIHRLEDLAEFYHEILGKDAASRFARFLPIGCDYESGEIAVILDAASDKPGFALFHVDQGLDDWEAGRGMRVDAPSSFEEWIAARSNAQV